MYALSRRVIKMEEIPKSFKRWFGKHFTDIDKIDLVMEYDRKINVAENQNAFMDKFSAHYIDKPTKEDIETIDNQRKVQEFEQRKLGFEEAFGIKINFVR